MLYTIGKKELYDNCISRNENAEKGITGAVWKDFSKAKEFRDKRARGFGVYAVEADWEQDAKDIGMEFRTLVKSGKLFFVDEESGEVLS